MKKIAVNTVFTAIFFIKRMNIMNELMNVFPGSPLARTKKPGNQARISLQPAILASFPGFFIWARGEPGNTFSDLFIH